MPVHFNEQDGRRVTRQTDIHVILNIVDGRVVHEFQRTGDNMRGDDPGDGLRGAFHFGENGHHGFGSLGRRHQFKDGLAGKCQRAFRGDEQFGEVVAVLAPPAASPGLHDFAGFGQDFKAHDIFFRGAVLQAAQPAGVLGDVAAHGGDGHGPGVGRIKQPSGRHCGRKVTGYHAGLNHRIHLFLIDFENPVQAVGQDNDSVGTVGDGPAAQVRPGTADSDGDAFLIAFLDQRPKLVRACGTDDKARNDRRQDCRVIRVVLAIRLARQDILPADDLLDFLNERKA